MMNNDAAHGTWYLQVCDDDGMPTDCPVRVTPATEASILAELSDLGLTWQQVPAP